MHKRRNSIGRAIRFVVAAAAAAAYCTYVYAWHFECDKQFGKRFLSKLHFNFNNGWNGMEDSLER